MSHPETIKIDEVEYVKKGATTIPTGNRKVVVVDRGWIFAGNVEVKEINGKKYLRLSDAVHVFSWSSIGFTGVLENPKDKNVNLKPMKHAVDVPLESVIFEIPVGDNWGK